MTPDQRLRWRLPYVANLPEKARGWGHEYERVNEWLVRQFGGPQSGRWHLLGLRARGRRVAVALLPYTSRDEHHVCVFVTLRSPTLLHTKHKSEKRQYQHQYILCKKRPFIWYIHITKSTKTVNNNECDYISTQ